MHLRVKVGFFIVTFLCPFSLLCPEWITSSVFCDQSHSNENTEPHLSRAVFFHMIPYTIYTYLSFLLHLLPSTIYAYLYQFGPPATNRRHHLPSVLPPYPDNFLLYSDNSLHYSDNAVHIHSSSTFGNL